MPHSITPNTTAASSSRGMREAWRPPALASASNASKKSPPRSTRAPWTGARAMLSAKHIGRVDPRAWEREDELVLSARTPEVPGRAALQTWEVHFSEPAQPALYFENHGARAGGGAMIWFESLDEDALYQIELQLSVLDGAIEIGSSDMSCTLSPAQGLDHRAHLLLDRPSGGAALLTLRPVDVRDWALYEVRVRKLSA